MSELRIVSYLMHGLYRATRHVVGCGTLALAERQSRDEAPHRVAERPSVYTEAQYAMLPGSDGILIKDHACVAKAESAAMSTENRA